MIWPFSKQQKSTSRNSSVSRASRSRNNSDSSLKARVESSATTKYHAVRIIPGEKACLSATSQATLVYLASQAPVTPLQDCSSKNNCRCRYKHLDDRRSDLRRESDIGLPAKSIPNERRSINDRRKMAIRY